MSVEPYSDVKEDSLIYRDCLPEDAKQFPIFAAQIARETQFTLHYSGKKYPIEKIQQTWACALNSSSEFYLGVFNAEKKLIGQLHFKVMVPSHPRIQHIGKFSIMVIQKYWGKGIANKMMRIMEQSAKKIGIHRIEAEVMTENNRALAFYKKLGYEVEGTRKQSLRIQGDYYNEFYIAKLI